MSKRLLTTIGVLGTLSVISIPTRPGAVKRVGASAGATVLQAPRRPVVVAAVGDGVVGAGSSTLPDGHRTAATPGASARSSEVESIDRRARHTSSHASPR